MVSEVEFWRLTLRHWVALVRRLNKNKEREDRQLANLLATLHVVHGDKAKPEDFLKKEKRSSEEVDKNILTLFKAMKYGGKDTMGTAGA